MKRFTTTILASIALIAVAAAPPKAEAQDSRSIYRAADAYREAVHHFEEQAGDVRAIDRFTLRLIDRLEDQTSDVRSAARRFEDASRLLAEFAEVTSLQASVEQAVFGDGCPIVRRALGGCWNEVLAAYTALEFQIRQLQSRHGVGFRGPSNCDHVGSRPFGQPFAQPGRGPSARIDAGFGGRPFGTPPASFNRHESLRFQSSLPGQAPVRSRARSTSVPSPFSPSAPAGFSRQSQPNVGALILGGLLSRIVQDR